MKRLQFARFTLLTAGVSLAFTLASFLVVKGAYFLYFRDWLLTELGSQNAAFLLSLDERANSIFMLGFVLAVLSAMAVTAVVLLLVVRSQAKRAITVMEALTVGELKSRISYSGLSVVDPIIDSFNKMANQLEQVILTLKEAQERKIQLVQELGHDLRTPLTSLRIALENMEIYYDKMTPEQRAFNLETVNYELNYMQRLIEFLFVLSKVNEPDYEVEFHSIDLRKLLEEEIEMRRKCETGKMKWEFEWRGEPVVIRGSRSLIIRLIRNLLDNGKKFSHGTVGIRWETRENGRGLLSVYDDGEGMSPEKIVGYGDMEISEFEISDVFKVGKSLGIGTRIIKAIADLHNWNVSIAPPNVDGTGTNILFEMELERDDLTLLAAVA